MYPIILLGRYAGVTSTPSSVITRERTTLELSFEALTNVSSPHDSASTKHVSDVTVTLHHNSARGSRATPTGDAHARPLAEECTHSSDGEESDDVIRKELPPNRTLDHVLLNQQLSRAASPVFGRDVIASKDAVSQDNSPSGGHTPVQGLALGATAGM